MDETSLSHNRRTSTIVCRPVLLTSFTNDFLGGLLNIKYVVVFDGDTVVINVSDRDNCERLTVCEVVL